jgi:hypothetical protein
MIFFWCEASCNNLNETFDTILGIFNHDAEDYYKSRIIKALNRAEESTSAEKRVIYDIAARVCLNIPVSELPDLWSISGLFIQMKDDTGAHFYACVCPPVYKAFIKQLKDSGDQILTVLVIVDLLVLYRYLLTS